MKSLGNEGKGFPKGSNRGKEENLANFHGDLRWMEESIDNMQRILRGGVGIDSSSVDLGTADKFDVMLYPDIDSLFFRE